MIRKDYILKLLYELFTAVNKILQSKKSLTEKQRDVEALYVYFNATADDYRQMDKDDIIPSLTVFDDDVVTRAEMLAEVMYADAKFYVGQYNQRIDIIKKSLFLFEYVEQHSDSFSFQRVERINELKKQIDKLQSCNLCE